MVLSNVWFHSINLDSQGDTGGFVGAEKTEPKRTERLFTERY